MESFFGKMKKCFMDMNIYVNIRRFKDSNGTYYNAQRITVKLQGLIT